VSVVQVFFDALGADCYTLTGFPRIVILIAGVWGICDCVVLFVAGRRGDGGQGNRTD